MKKLILELVQKDEDYTLIIFQETPIYVSNSLIPLHFNLLKLLPDKELFNLKLIDYLSDICTILELLKDLSTVLIYVEEIDDKPFARSISSQQLSRFGYLNLSISDLEKLISSYLPSINFTCNMVKSQFSSSIYTAIIKDRTIDFGDLPSDRPLFIFLKAVVSSIILSGELENRSKLEIDLKSLDKLLIDGGSRDLLKSFYPSGNLLFNLKMGLESAKVPELISKVSKIPTESVAYFIKG